MQKSMAVQSIVLWCHQLPEHGFSITSSFKIWLSHGAIHGAFKNDTQHFPPIFPSSSDPNFPGKSSWPLAICFSCSFQSLNSCNNKNVGKIKVILFTVLPADIFFFFQFTCGWTVVCACFLRGRNSNMQWLRHGKSSPEPKNANSKYRIIYPGDIWLLTVRQRLDMWHIVRVQRMRVSTN